MTTTHDLEELRVALQRYGDESDRRAVPAPGPAGVHTRLDQVRGRVRRARRRRAAGTISLAAASVATVAVVTSLLGPGAPSSGPAPAGTNGSGEPPATMTAAGFNYRLADVRSVSDDVEVAMDLPRADRPRLLAWSTAGEAQDVSVLIGGSGRWVSEADDYADHVVVPEGYAGRILANTSEPGVELALYELVDSDPGPGVGADGIHYRQEIGARTLAGAVVGEPGQLELELPYVVPEGAFFYGFTCTGLPAGARVRVSLDGERDDLFGACDGSRFDAGGLQGMYASMLGAGLPAGESRTARLSVTLADDLEDDPVPLDPAEHPQARLSLGIYGEPTVRVGEREVPVSAERWGHSFSYSAAGVDDGLEHTLRLRGDGPWLARPVVEGMGGATLVTEVDGRRVRAGDRFAPDPLIYLDADSGSLTVRAAESEAGSVTSVGAIIYERVE